MAKRKRKDEIPVEVVLAQKAIDLQPYLNSTQFPLDHLMLHDGIKALPGFDTDCALAIGAAVDQVLWGDQFEELDKASKTAIGAFNERSFLRTFGLKQLEKTHKIDTEINSVLVDIKTTTKSEGAWMIPLSDVGHWCLLFYLDCRKRKSSVGFIFVSPDDVRKSGNGDRKVTLHAEGQAKITWLKKTESF